jgi:hypothetical protein
MVEFREIARGLALENLYTWNLIIDAIKKGKERFKIRINLNNELERQMVDCSGIPPRPYRNKHPDTLTMVYHGSYLPEGGKLRIISSGSS